MKMKNIAVRIAKEKRKLKLDLEKLTQLKFDTVRKTNNNS
jgi:hypothetical protein